MFARKFIEYVDTHADQLCEEFMQKIKRSDRCTGLLHRVPVEEQRQSMREIYRNLTDWLLNNTESVTEERYVSQGMRRARQGVLFSELFWAVCATRSTSGSTWSGKPYWTNLLISGAACNCCTRWTGFLIVLSTLSSSATNRPVRKSLAARLRSCDIFPPPVFPKAHHCNSGISLAQTPVGRNSSLSLAKPLTVASALF